MKNTPRPSIRRMLASDLPGAMRLVQAAGWNQIEQDWLRLLDLEPDGCLLIEVDGEVVATATTVTFGRDVAWIGMVLTDPRYRGRGFARALMEECLAFADERSVAHARLDASDMGRPLYQSLGFQDSYPVERWRRLPSPAPRILLPSFALDAALDRTVFGADRRCLLLHLARGEAASIPGGGFAFGRRGRECAYFGPCVATEADHARRLASWFVGQHQEEPAYWDLAPHNREAVNLAKEFGFAPVRQLFRMTKPIRGSGEFQREQLEKIFALAGFEYG